MSSEYSFPNLHLPPFRLREPIDHYVDDSAEGSGREMQIWLGYLAAGDIFIEAQSRSHNWPANLIYPAIFCYRHGLEVVMKAIVRE